jgi:hypothetical protein
MLKKLFQHSLLVLAIMMGTVGWQSNSVTTPINSTSESNAIPHLVTCANKTVTIVGTNSYTYNIPSGCAYRDVYMQGVSCSGGGSTSSPYYTTQTFGNPINKVKITGRYPACRVTVV